LTIVHSGQFHTQYALNVSVESRDKLLCGERKITDFLRFNRGKPNLLCRSPYYLFKAIRDLLDTGKIKKNDLQCLFIGTASPADIKLSELFGVKDMVQYTGYLNHDECVSRLDDADVLLLPLHKTEDSRDPLIVPGKTYEYLASGKPILGLVPNGDCRNYLIASGQGFVAEPDNVGEISGSLLHILSLKKTHGRIPVKRADNYVQRFERSKLTQRLAGVLDYAISRVASQDMPEVE
jgi:glycosyltransferase involved in cell wall biosynthesis